MKKITIALFVLCLGAFNSLKADEGMWLPILIQQNMATMTEMGIQLTAEDIYSINNPGVKDAIVALDHGSCTGEVISPEGLVLTNHHCGYGEIQAHSSVEHDYLSDGFWAMSKEEELANPGKTMSFLIRAEDVSERIVAAIPAGVTEAQRYKIIDSVASIIQAEAIDGTHYEARVESLLEGNLFYVFVYETYRDIRLVGAPPSAIGKFGADTDNWMWPRHTGDFSMFRIYTAPDGSPADYSEENVPLKPKHYLPVSLDGIQKDDFAFIMGYPGSTTRYMRSWDLEYTMDYTNDNRAKIRGIKQEIWKKHMDADDAVRIKYASKYSRSSNYWKYSITQNKSLKRLGVLAQKQAEEAEFTAWVNADATRQQKYGQALTLVEEGVEANVAQGSAIQYLIETQLRGAELFLTGYRAGAPLMAAFSMDSVEAVEAAKASFQSQMNTFFKDYDAATDQEATKALLKLYMKDVDPAYYPSYMESDIKNGDVDAFVDNIFAKSIFVSQDNVEAFLAKPSAKKLAKDPVFKAGMSIFTLYQGLYQQGRESNLKKSEGMRLFVAGLLEMYPDKAFYSDANSTMRLTYGSVGDYDPADAVHYDFITTLAGVMEKEDPTVREFNVPARLKEIYETKDYGQYGNEDGTMTVCFTTNNDITGGNSGSPVINAKGHLIGAAFDGNSEAMSGDIKFETEMQKCINVDIRYVLLIIDKYAGATNLIDEMTLVKTPAEATAVPAEEAEAVEMN